MYKVAVLSALYNAFENAAGGQQTTAAEVFNRSFTCAHKKLSVRLESSVQLKKTNHPLPYKQGMT